MFVGAFEKDVLVTLDDGNSGGGLMFTAGSCFSLTTVSFARKDEA